MSEAVRSQGDMTVDELLRSISGEAEGLAELAKQIRGGEKSGYIDRTVGPRIDLIDAYLGSILSRVANIGFKLDEAGDRGELETVTFQWHRKHGGCYDCGLPAAYQVGDAPAGRSDHIRVCSVCAATRAADGESIVALNVED